MARDVCLIQGILAPSTTLHILAQVNYGKVLCGLGHLCPKICTLSDEWLTGLWPCAEGFTNSSCHLGKSFSFFGTQFPLI